MKRTNHILLFLNLTFLASSSIISCSEKALTTCSTPARYSDIKETETSTTPFQQQMIEVSVFRRSLVGEIFIRFNDFVRSLISGMGSTYLQDVGGR